MIKKIKIKKGFSIGEVIISVFIVGMILTALVTMYSTGIREFLDERDSVVASLLAQEGIELIRNVRDNAWVNGDSLLTNLSQSNGCTIDLNSVNSGNGCSGNNYALEYSSGFYNHGSGSEFSRKIIIDDSLGNSNQGEEKIRVTSFVTWDYEPVDGKTISDCSVSRKCVFSEAELTEWGDSTF